MGRLRNKKTKTNFITISLFASHLSSSSTSRVSCLHICKRSFVSLPVFPSSTEFSWFRLSTHRFSPMHHFDPCIHAQLTKALWHAHILHTFITASAQRSYKHTGRHRTAHRSHADMWMRPQKTGLFMKFETDLKFVEIYISYTNCTSKDTVNISNTSMKTWSNCLHFRFWIPKVLTF